VYRKSSQTKCSKTPVLSPFRAKNCGSSKLKIVGNNSFVAPTNMQSVEMIKNPKIHSYFISIEIYVKRNLSPNEHSKL
jgi:hypothetical protein